MRGFACISIIIGLWVWSWAGTGGELEVLDGDSWLVSAFSLASSISVEPFHGIPRAAPAADSDGHTVGEVLFVLVHIVSIIACACRGAHCLGI